jgi:cell fate regulator YaaT (PSP1 superfamily)
VKVEADRGEDMGRVTGISYLDGFKQSRLTVSSFGADSGSFKHVTRTAAVDERKLMAMKADEETRATNFCRARVHALGLPMSVVDAEFQFDRRKLTFYFEAERLVVKY